MANQTVEERLARVEQELARMKVRMKSFQPKSNWITALRGTAKGNDAYAEICRLGKEMRDAEEEPEE